MSSLKAFLNPMEISDKEVVISERFREAEQAVAWKLRPVTQEENAEIVRQYTKKTKKGEPEFDRIGYMQELAAAGVVYPDLNNAELQKAYGVIGAARLLGKMLLVGEFGKLSQEIQRLSGLDEDINEEMEDAKN